MPALESFTRRRVLGSGIALGTAAIVAGHLGFVSARDEAANREATPTVPSSTQHDGTWLFVDDLGTEIRPPSTASGSSPNCRRRPRSGISASVRSAS